MPKTPQTPALHFAPELLLRAQGVRVAFFDVDGVLTDGGLYFSEQAESIKRFHTLDGHGLKLLRLAGIEPVIVSGRDSAALRSRMQSLGVVHAHYGVEHKPQAAAATLQTLGLGWEQAAAMGDDWPDLPLLRACTLAVAPPQAHIEVRACADYITAAAAGAGSAREFCDLLLVASGRYAQLLAQAQA